jgi:hypothetical protein
VTVLGWLIFGSFMAESTGADPHEVKRVIAEQVSALVGSAVDDAP